LLLNVEADLVSVLVPVAVCVLILSVLNEELLPVDTETVEEVGMEA
jgi:hypothetical protein